MEITPAGCDHEIPEHLFMCSRLYIAAFRGYTDEVFSLLAGSSGTAVEPANSRPSPAAQEHANHHGGCSIREVTAERSTLLHIAAGEGHDELIAELCSHDSSLLSSSSSSGNTPLHCAARAGHAGAVRDIVRLARANVEEDRLRAMLRGMNATGDTALHLAARHGHGEAVEELMEVAPETALELNGGGVSPLYLAVMSRSVRAVRAILSCRDASAAGPSSQNALHAAVLQSSEMVSLLLQWKPTLATKVDSSKSTPLHFASSDGDCSIIQAILTHLPRSAINIQDNKGLSPLHIAALMGHTETVRMLLQFSPASADICDNQGQSFLHAAAMKGHSSIISYAVKNSMLKHLLNAQDKEGNTPLHLAVVVEECKVVSKLLSSGEVSLVVKLHESGAQFQPQRQDLIEKWNAQDIMKWRDNTSKNLAVVSTLIATVAFAAAFNVPGSYGHDGKANLAGDPMYNAFLILDTISMVTSVVATILLVYGRASRSHRSWPSFVISMYFLWLSINCMVFGFFTAIAAVSKKGIKIAMSQLIYHGMYILTMQLTFLAMPGSFISTMKFLVSGRMERQQHAKRHIKRQYPFIAFYTFNVIFFFIINNIAMLTFDATRALSY
uniref:PGG domain-containing protein n=1 Tax=Oryza meridionalis TaxID=40149 RepID=A0A0E0F5B8_9ORYZ